MYNNTVHMSFTSEGYCSMTPTYPAEVPTVHLHWLGVTRSSDSRYTVKDVQLYKLLKELFQLLKQK